MSQLQTRFILSDNDKQIINHHSKGKKISSVAMKAMTILSHTFGGLHHLDYKKLDKFDWEESMWSEFTISRNLATFDNQELTLLVILAHDLAVRVEIQPCNFRNLRLVFHERKRDGDFTTRHPTLEDTTEGFRKGNKHFA